MKYSNKSPHLRLVTKTPPRPFALSLESEFSEALESAGIACPSPIRANGEFLKFLSGETACWYCLHSSGVGAFGSFERGMARAWRSELQILREAMEGAI